MQVLLSPQTFMLQTRLESATSSMAAQRPSPQDYQGRGMSTSGDTVVQNSRQ